MHVGLSLEFKRMNVLAEGFAQACVHHDYWYTEFLHKAEADAKHAVYPALSLDDAIDEARADPVIRDCSSVDPSDLERATAELITTEVYTAAASQYPPHECRIDFFLMHDTNASVWHSASLREPSLTDAQKARLLEYTSRVTFMLYAGMGCPFPKNRLAH